jgi:hypothetical protein
MTGGRAERGDCWSLVNQGWHLISGMEMRECGSGSISRSSRFFASDEIPEGNLKSAFCDHEYVRWEREKAIERRRREKREKVMKKEKEGEREREREREKEKEKEKERERERER